MANIAIKAGATIRLIPSTLDSATSVFGFDIVCHYCCSCLFLSVNMAKKHNLLSAVILV